MQVILKLGWKEKVAGGTFPTRLLYRQVDLPYVPRAGESVELWPDWWRDVTSVRLHLRNGTAYPELDFGNLSVNTTPKVAQAAVVAARLNGWDETWPPDAPPTVYVSSN